MLVHMHWLYIMLIVIAMVKLMMGVMIAMILSIVMIYGLFVM